MADGQGASREDAKGIEVKRGVECFIRFREAAARPPGLPPVPPPTPLRGLERVTQLGVRVEWEAARRLLESQARRRFPDDEQKSLFQPARQFGRGWSAARLREAPSARDRPA